jgi:hypothetical protein
MESIGGGETGGLVGAAAGDKIDRWIKMLA